MIDRLASVLQAQGSEISIILVIALVIAFIAAFKIMKTVMETVIVSVLSGGFYLAMRYLQGGAISLNDLLLFSFLGATLYMAYSLASTVYGIASTVIPLPYKVAKIVMAPVDLVIEKYRERKKKKSYTDRGEDEESSDNSKSTKEVVLGEDED